MADAAVSFDFDAELRFDIEVGDGRATEELVAAGRYGYAHSCIDSQNFPAGRSSGPRMRRVALIRFHRGATADEVLRAAAGLGLERPTYEDALYFGIAHPDVQRSGPVVFLHEPWVGFFGRRDVLCLWTNAGRRELGLEDYDERFPAGCRFAFADRGAPGMAPQPRASRA